MYLGFRLRVLQRFIDISYSKILSSLLVYVDIFKPCKFFMLSDFFLHFTIFSIFDKC